MSDATESIGSSLDADGNEVPDGSHPRRETRPEGWLEKAIADGSVRDPNVPFEQPAPSPDAAVIEPPVATLTGQ